MEQQVIPTMCDGCDTQVERGRWYDLCFLLISLVITFLFVIPARQSMGTIVSPFN